MASSNIDENLIAVYALMDAAFNGELELLKKCAAKLNCRGETLAETFLRVKDVKNLTALHVAAQAGKTQICNYLIQSLKLDINLQDGIGNTALHHAINCEKYPTFEFLLNIGANPNVANHDGHAPLHFAIGRDRKEYIRLLLQKGAAIEGISSAAGTPLQFAVCKGKKDSITTLLKHKANPNPLVDQNSSSPLVSAFFSGSLDTMELLLKAGADPNRFSNGITPLICAACDGVAEAVKLLLKYGADPNVTNSNGLTALELSAPKGHHEVCKILFPLTKKSPYIEDWTLKGVLEFGAENMFRIKVEGTEYYAYKSKGEAAFKEKDYFAAVHWYSKALDAKPNDAAALSNRSLCHSKMKNGELALADAEACISVRPDWAKAHYRAGVAYTLLKNYVYATQAFSDANKLDPDDKDIQASLRESVQREFGIPVNNNLRFMHF